MCILNHGNTELRDEFGYLSSLGEFLAPVTALISTYVRWHRNGLNKLPKQELI